MSQQELVIKVIRALERNHIPYMATGSLVSSLQGEPRATHDFDIVISIGKSRIDLLVSSFPSPDFYIDIDSAKDAINNEGTFNLIEMKSGEKVDFWLLTDEPFDQSRFSRAIEESIFGIKIKTSSPEDTILMKLKWSKLSGGSEKQFLDALRVYEVQYSRLDKVYVDGWVIKLGVEDIWKRLQGEARPL
jgi:hypothetical protein